MKKFSAPFALIVLTMAMAAGCVSVSNTPDFTSEDVNVRATNFARPSVNADWTVSITNNTAKNYYFLKIFATCSKDDTPVGVLTSQKRVNLGAYATKLVPMQGRTPAETDVTCKVHDMKSLFVL